MDYEKFKEIYLRKRKPHNIPSPAEWDEFVKVFQWCDSLYQKSLEYKKVLETAKETLEQGVCCKDSSIDKDLWVGLDCVNTMNSIDEVLKK